MGLLVVLCVALAVGLAACGPDSEDDQLSVSEYRERGNRICREAKREAEETARGEDPAKVFDGLVEEAERSQRDFEALEPPDELRRLHDRSISEGREALRLLREARESIEAERAGALREVLRKLEVLVEQGNETARELGLRDCVAELP